MNSAYALITHKNVHAIMNNILSRHPVRLRRQSDHDVPGGHVAILDPVPLHSGIRSRG